MNYYTFTMGGEEFKARLTIKDAIKCEERLGKNPINVLTDCQNDNLPSIKDMLIIVHQSMQTYHHGVKYDDVLDLFQKDLENGESVEKLVMIVVDILKQSGLIKIDD